MGKLETIVALVVHVIFVMVYLLIFSVGPPLLRLDDPPLSLSAS